LKKVGTGYLPERVTFVRYRQSGEWLSTSEYTLISATPTVTPKEFEMDWKESDVLYDSINKQVYRY
jgi:hypothetical protein